MLAAQEIIIEREYVTGREALVRRLMALTRDPDEATDLAHEAFFRFAREVAAGRTPVEPGAWLYRVGANLAMSRGRHLAVVDRRAASLPTPAAPPVPEHVVVRAELGRALRAELLRLSEPERRAVVLAAEGYPPTEIATLIGRTPGATRTMLCRARGKLRTGLLEASAGDGDAGPRGSARLAPAPGGVDLPGRMIAGPWSRCSVDERSSGGNGRSPD